MTPAQQQREIARQAREIAPAQREAERARKAPASREAPREGGRPTATSARRRQVETAVRTGGRVLTSKVGQSILRGVFGTLFSR